MNSNFEEDDDLFYFESDHLALKGNKDYSEVLKTIFILDSQRAKAIKDYDKVAELHKEALEDPLAFIQKLKDSKDLGVPELQIIADVPNVQWSQYKMNLPEEGLKFINEKYNNPSENLSFASEEKRLQGQADTHNKPWTTEEQRRLEELLVIHPPEPIEFRRFKKIAAALGNRTVKQVSSRVQKYFLKLYRAGLPIPGRIPKYAERTKKSKLHIHQRYNHYLFKPTTFFPQLDIPVTMNESEPIPGPSTNSTSNPNLLNYLIPESLDPAEQEQMLTKEPTNDIDIQLRILRRVKYEKQKENDIQSNFQHYGYKCDYCNEEPITGPRWHCKMCKDDSVDFCSDCVVAQLYSGKPHPLSHKLDIVRGNVSESGWQSDNSSNESMSESAFGSSNRNFDSSNNSSASDSDIESRDFIDDQSSNMEIKEEEMELDDQIHKEIKTESMCSNSSYKHETYSQLDIDVKKEFGSFGIDRVHSVLHEDMDNNINNDSSTDVSNYVNYDHDRFMSDIMTDTQNVSYNYLHSNLLLDST
ncbi:hypothetical protein RN001_009647 [Aquatica leii]|uniref:ZZ-type zinc finger-containing protein 3 n=1 Tax=Aquatica leii TaxID=1421715 RepID=A0AAN7S888_9COLE|nr:hypothetical protein RN001_009647 [Aquatica leii]